MPLRWSCWKKSGDSRGLSPIGTAPNLLFLANYQEAVAPNAPDFSFPQWIVLMLPIALLLGVLIGIVCAQVQQPDRITVHQFKAARRQTLHGRHLPIVQFHRQ